MDKDKRVRVFIWFEAGIPSWQPVFDSCPGNIQKNRTKKDHQSAFDEVDSQGVA